jgi:hypothetical protein
MEVVPLRIASLLGGLAQSLGGAASTTRTLPSAATAKPAASARPRP